MTELCPGDGILLYLKLVFLGSNLNCLIPQQAITPLNPKMAKII